MSDPEQPAAPQVLPEAPPPAEAAAAAAQPPPPDVVAAPVITLETPPMLSGPKSGDKRSAEDAAEGDAKRAAAEYGSSGVPAAAPANTERESYVAVPNDHVGRVIGKQGATLRVLQSLSNAQIDVPAECEPGTNNRHIKIRGDEKALEYVTQLIRQKCDPVMSNQPLVLPPDGRIITKVITIPDQHVGRVIGRAGETIRQLQDLTRCHVDVAHAATPGQMPPMRPITLTGSPDMIAQAEEMIRVKVEGGQLPVGAAMTMGGMMGAGAIPPQVSAEWVKAYVPDDMVGKIIGKGGATIRELQDASGAHIDIAKQCAPGMTQREITITGGPAQMAYCNLLLQGKICEGDMSHPAYQQAYANYSQVYAQTQGGPGGYAQGGGYGGYPQAAGSGYTAAAGAYGAPGQAAPAASGYGAPTAGADPYAGYYAAQAAQGGQAGAYGGYGAAPQSGGYPQQQGYGMPQAGGAAPPQGGYMGGYGGAAGYPPR